ncbi:MAG: V-type ATP synthase subunit E [Acidimicrobiia bacterium]
MNSDLAPLKRELEKRAADEVARIEEEAQRSSKDILDEARAEATRRQEEARRQGRAMADAESERQLLMARREAGRHVLAERKATLEDLRRRCLQAVHELRESPDYADIEERLVGEGRRTLGDDDCEVERDPNGMGGVWVTSGTRLVDLSLSALVELCLAGLGDAVEALWA